MTHGVTGNLKSFSIVEFVTLFLKVITKDFLPISISTVGKKLHLHLMILVSDGVNERELSAIPEKH